MGETFAAREVTAGISRAGLLFEGHRPECLISVLLPNRPAAPPVRQNTELDIRSARSGLAVRLRPDPEAQDQKQAGKVFETRPLGSFSADLFIVL